MYVDGVVVISDSHSMLIDVKPTLHSQFEIKYLGVLKHFLDLEVARPTKTIESFCTNTSVVCLNLLAHVGVL